MSVSEVLSILHDDDFEGSTDEISISQEVFYGINSAGSERCMLKGFINFGSQQHKLVESSPFLNTGAVTSESSSKVSFLKDDDNNVHGGSPRTCASASFTEGLVHAERNDHTVPAKRMKLSIDELSGFSPFPHSALASDVLLKGTISGFDHPKTRLDSQIVVCHVVESSREGVRSRCYQLKHGAEAEKKGCSLDTVLPKDNSLGPEGSEGKEIVVSNTMASPVSQDSCATKALVTVPAVTNVDHTGSHQRAVRKRKKGTPFELDDDDTPWTSNCTKELRPFLRRRMFHLLAAAGWSIEKRKRQCRSYEEFVFVSPQERPVRELAKAWSVCGQILHVHRYMQMEAENGRQWANIEQLCSDLYNTITNMDSELKHLEPKDAIVRQWVLLNPFVTVVFVDRKLRELRAGNVVEVKFNASDTAQKPVVVGKGKRSGGGCAKTKRCVSPVAIESTVIDFGTQSQGGKVEASTSRSIYVSEGSSLRLLETHDKVESHLGDVCINDSGPQYFPSLPACGSHITSLQPAHDLYVVPVPSGTMELVPGVSQEFSALQYDASDAIMDEPNQMCAEDAKFAQCFDSSSLRYNRTDGRLASKPRGRPKKSKKVSEIKITSFSEDEMATPSGVEGDAQKMNGQANKANNKNCKRMSSSTKSCNKRTSKKKSLPCKLKDDDLLISAIVEQKKFRSNSKKGNVKAGNKIRRPKKRKNHKSGCRLLPRNLVKGSRHFPEERWTSIAKRMVLCWLLHAGVVYLNDIIQYRNLMDETVVKEGIITRDGISCRCCNKVFSMSGFNAHAGLEMNCLCLNLFMDSGQPLTLRLLEAWSTEYKARKAGLRAVQSDEFDQNDDSCGLCGDGGELLCCDKCPSTFHQSCLSAEELPEGSWYCASCTCWICGNLVDDEGSSTQCGFKCNQCEHKYHLGCLKELGVDRISSNPWFCSANCEEVHAGLKSRVALHNVIADGFSWSVLRCIQDDQNFHSAQQLALKAECNSKLAVALTVMEECFVSMVDSRTGIDMIPQVVYNWGSEFPRLDYHGFYTVVLEKDDVLISVASIRVHGVEVAEMPLVATCSKYRRKGMCRRLISAIEQMLISFKVEKLVVAAIPDLVETWTVGFGFVPVEEEEKKSLNKINLMVFPGTVLLKKTLYSGQPASLQGVGRPACNLSLGMDKSVQKWASSGAQCENKSENDECYGSEDAGLTSVKLVSPHCMEVVEAQKTSSGSTKRESLNTDRVESSGCMSLEFCGHTETNDFLDVSPHKEASETVQDMRMQVSYTDLMTAAVESTGNAFNCRENWKSQDWTFSNEGVCHEKLQHELSFHVSSEVQNQPTPLTDNVGNYTEQGGMSFNWATEVENELAKPTVPHESADQEKAVPEAITSSATNEISTNSSHLQEGTVTAVGVVPGELKIKISSITGIGEATVTAVVKAESKNDSLVLLEDEAHSIEAVQFPVTCTNGKVDDMETIKEPDTNKELLGLICQSIDMIPHGSAASEAGKSMETQLTAEQEPQQTSSPNNSSHPCSSVALEAQTESASKSNAKLQLV